MKSLETITEFGTGIVYLSDLNKKIETGEINDVIMFSETMHEKRIAELADQIVSEGKHIVLVAGPSSSGKTSFTKRLCMHLWINGRKPIYLGTDDYFIARDKMKVDENGNKNFENLDALDLDLFNKQLSDLLAGKLVDIPRFDFMSGNPVFGERQTQAHEGQMIVVEGIHGLNPELTADIPDEEKFRIFIAPMTEPKIDDKHKIQTSDIRKIRRMVRDNAHRGWDVITTLSTWENIRNGEYENILPYKDNADALFDSSLPYELAALKPYALPLLEKVELGNQWYPEAQRMIDILSKVDALQDETYIVGDSILREFVGGSIIVK
ncbi:MAG: nucleoside kinase [Bacillota bacterium]|nr:nucleoside kinase [Bacillota bacterium]